MHKQIGLMLLLAVLLAMVALQAQTPAPSAIKRNILSKSDVPPMTATDGYVVEVEVAPGGESGRHHHLGQEFNYVVAGEATLYIDGKSPVTLKPGVGGHIEPGVIHNVKNNSTTDPFKVAVVYLIEQGKPVAIPDPPK